MKLKKLESEIAECSQFDLRIFSLLVYLWCHKVAICNIPKHLQKFLGGTLYSSGATRGRARAAASSVWPPAVIQFASALANWQWRSIFGSSFSKGFLQLCCPSLRYYQLSYATALFAETISLKMYYPTHLPRQRNILYCSSSVLLGFKDHRR